MNFGIGGMASILPLYSPQIYNNASSSSAPAQEAIGDSIAPVEYSGPLAGKTIGGEPAAVFIGMLAILFIIGWYGRNTDTLGGAIPQDLRVGLYNWLTVGIMAATFFVIGKVVFTKFPIPGVSSFFKAL